MPGGPNLGCYQYGKSEPVLPLELIIGSYYLHFCESYHTASYHFISIISWAKLWARARVLISPCLIISSSKPLSLVPAVWCTGRWLSTGTLKSNCLGSKPRLTTLVNYFSRPQFPHLSSEDNDDTYLMELWWGLLHEIMLTAQNSPAW